MERTVIDLLPLEIQTLRIFAKPESAKDMPTGLMKQALRPRAVENSAERRLNRQSESQASPAKDLPQGPQPIGLEATARGIQPESFRQLFRQPFQVSRHA
ncbi:MAG: hypothetical protein B7Y36_08885 [Novosphingobium sp. 28-62-57]|nr:MAG: hypothetical protein B7Y36_08885 [Novosphingobium sp. 28-62-57]